MNEFITNFCMTHNSHQSPPASEVTTVWRYINSSIIIINYYSNMREKNVYRPTMCARACVCSRRTTDGHPRVVTMTTPQLAQSSTEHVVCCNVIPCVIFFHFINAITILSTRTTFFLSVIQNVTVKINYGHMALKAQLLPIHFLFPACDLSTFDPLNPNHSHTGTPQDHHVYQLW